MAKSVSESADIRLFYFLRDHVVKRSREIMGGVPHLKSQSCQVKVVLDLMVRGLLQNLFLCQMDILIL